MPEVMFEAWKVEVLPIFRIKNWAYFGCAPMIWFDIIFLEKF